MAAGGVIGEDDARRRALAAPARGPWAAAPAGTPAPAAVNISSSGTALTNSSPSITGGHKPLDYYAPGRASQLSRHVNRVNRRYPLAGIFLC